VSERLIENYDAFPRIEDEFHAVLEESLHPRGPDGLFDLVVELDLPRGSFAIDVGCGEGRHSQRLTELGFDVLGVDPVPRHIELARENAPEARFELGTAESLPVARASADLVWFRDVLELVHDLDATFTELARVLRADGRALVYSMFAAEALEPEFWSVLDVVPSSTDPLLVEAAMQHAGLRIDRCVHIGSDWGEFAEEESGKPGKRLLWAARLGREPARYIMQFGRRNYEIMLADCLWHVYAMIGKTERRAYVLTKP
jgi:ubiquinone/menaquinone biosynthesis C-methylase UbiE